MTILVLAPHADDEVLGMGGAIAKFVSEGLGVEVAVLTGSGNEPHPIWPTSHWDAIRAECRTAMTILGCKAPIFCELPAACLDNMPAHEINEVVANLIANVDPEEVYVPFSFDLHKDHGAIAYGASVAARPYLAGAKKIRRVLAYETLSETHLSPPYLAPAFQPNVFINISETIDKKIAAMQAYASQIQPDNQPRSAAALKALATLRGTHIGVAAAEAFVLLGEYQR
ncbi:PIG-L deacetylase family protein [Pararhodobacter oceanensis]|uniref:PIG-L domain-containing protein n=1 Tax=Pararhodobacter oceanensis TaxID=2172121 RepID=A0A2T8HPH9_9RHOB|nr:PIG-L deacetylase family protein [Pararhodobacter oceanensis]PVH27351.1 PIG-L domain-containing protein [Pararhodobacter oceanensis]